MARRVFNRRNGKFRMVNPKRSKIMKRVARTRRYIKKGGPLRPAHKRKIALALKRVRRTGRTKYGRKARYGKRRRGGRGKKRS